MAREIGDAEFDFDFAVRLPRLAACAGSSIASMHARARNEACRRAGPTRELQRKSRYARLCGMRQHEIDVDCSKRNRLRRTTVANRQHNRAAEDRAR